jgi:hypothetical protein
VGGNGVDSLRRGAVEHDRHRCRPLRGLAQEVPRHLVGVPRRRGDEQPQVGRRQELSGQVAVALLDRVDVGRIEDGEPLGDHVQRDQLQRMRVVRGVVDPLELG